jgi:hypothetical protein
MEARSINEDLPRRPGCPRIIKASPGSIEMPSSNGRPAGLTVPGLSHQAFQFWRRNPIDSSKLQHTSLGRPLFALSVDNIFDIPDRNHHRNCSKPQSQPGPTANPGTVTRGRALAHALPFWTSTFTSQKRHLTLSRFQTFSPIRASRLGLSPKCRPRARQPGSQ